MEPFDSFTLAPMSAGDIIDRAVRLYKRHSLVLLRIVLGPSLVAYVGAVMFSIGYRNFSTVHGDERVAATTSLMAAGGALWFAGKFIFYAVLGGSSRSLVAYFFNGKPILARDVYRAVRERIWSLIGAMAVVLMMVFAVLSVMLFAEMILMVAFGLLAALMMDRGSEWQQVIVGFLVITLTAGVAMFSFLMVYSRLVYVPQILMVENKSVSHSISRSFSLANGEARRTGAVILFWIYVAWSLWVLLTVPMAAYADSIGVDIAPFSTTAPLWYNIASQTITQLSEILIAPVAMVGFTLLYLNSRVRKEGYDVELLANRVLAPPPALPPTRSQARAATPGPPPSGFPTILGLSDPPPSPPVDAPPPPVAAPPPGIEAVAEPPEIVAAAPSAAAAPAGSKICLWCGSNGSMEDRFCRVCGSVF